MNHMSLLLIFAPAALVGSLAEIAFAPRTRRKVHNFIHDLTTTDPRRRAKRTFC